MSNGEMAVNIFSKLPKSRVQLVGLEGTAGSISMNGGTVALPCVTFEHTIAQSWDPATNAVQVEANGARVGGLLPDVPIERTVENLHAFVAHGVAMEQEAIMCVYGATSMLARDLEGGASPEPRASPGRIRDAEKKCRAMFKDGVRPDLAPRLVHACIVGSRSLHSIGDLANIAWKEDEPRVLQAPSRGVEPEAWPEAEPEAARATSTSSASHTAGHAASQENGSRQGNGLNRHWTLQKAKFGTKGISRKPD